MLTSIKRADETAEAWASIERYLELIPGYSCSYRGHFRTTPNRENNTTLIKLAKW